MSSRPSRGSSLHVVLLAGGSGTRFWPMSRTHQPKQLLTLVGREPLLRTTWRRARKLTPQRRIWVVAPASLRKAILDCLPELSRDQFIVEPSPRDTGPATGLACAAVAQRDPTATVALLPTDHVIDDVAGFVSTVRAAETAAADGALVCMGVKPTHAATGYGYLKAARPAQAKRAVPVERFVEKPSAARAKRFLRTQRYYWNAGMFVWRAEAFLAELKRSAPTIARAVQGHLAGKSGAWERATRLSVDYAVMEKARDVRLVPLGSPWDDLGSWDAAARRQKQNGRRGAKSKQPIFVDSANSVTFGEGRQVALVGVPDVVVVDTPDALLVVSRDQTQRVREVVETLRQRGRKDLL